MSMPCRLIRIPSFILAAIACLAMEPPAAKAQNTLTDEEKARILKRLDEIRGITRETRFGRYANALAAYTAAAETPAKSYAFYLDCIKLVRFDEHGKSFSEFREWRERNIKWIRESEHSTMLQLQLRYLVMTIRALHMEDRSKIIPQLQSFLEDGIGKQKAMGEHAEKLQESVTRTVFAQAYGLDKTLKTDSRWEYAPLHLAGHYKQLILPLLREEGNAKGLERAWDRLISMEIAMMEPVEDVKRKDDFVTSHLPSMKWAKWRDVAENGERARAAMKMLDLLEKHKGHDNVEGWIQDLINIVNGVTLRDEDFEVE